MRDDQGVAIHPQSGKLWTSENGPKGGDEINVIEPGKNYGFPTISYGHEYSGKPINNDRTRNAATGVLLEPIDRAVGNDFLHCAPVPGVAGKSVRRVVGEERLLTALDTRMRDVRQGLDGALYVMTDGPDGRILKLVPQN